MRDTGNEVDVRNINPLSVRVKKLCCFTIYGFLFIVTILKFAKRQAGSQEGRFLKSFLVTNVLMNLQ